MPGTATPILFVPGYWHGASCWSEVLLRVSGAGRPAAAVDLAGHGLNAGWPAAFDSYPVDPAALATEVSPVAAVDLGQAADLLLSQIVALGRGEPVTVVAHSMAGVVLTRVAQRAPDLVARAVYVAAMMPASGVSGAEYATAPENTGHLLASALRGNPAVIGAMRLDVRSTDPEYRRQLQEAFYNDVDPVVARAALELLTPDAPAGIAAGATILTEDGWGAVPRTYVTCARDMAIRLPLQKRFIAEADAAFPDPPTSVVELDSGHSPFLSMADRVADIVANLD